MRRLVALTALALVLTASQAPCHTWYISPDGFGDFENIKAGIIAASPGDTLLLADGTYSGIENTELSYAGKAIVIKSESGDPHSCVIDIQGDELLWRRGFMFFNGEGPGSVLEGVTIMNGYGYEGSAIWCWGASPTISQVILRRNTAVLNGAAVYCGGGSSPTVRNVTFVGNSANVAAAVYAASNSLPVIEKSIIAFNRGGGAVAVGDENSSVSVYCSDIYGNVDGDWTGMMANQNGFSGNICLDPMFCLDESPGEPYMLDAASPCVPGCPPGLDFMGAVEVGCGQVVTQIEATVDFEPDILNLGSRGHFVTCYIELPFGYDVEDIDEGTILLGDSLTADEGPIEVGDYDDDGVTDLMVKFLRDEVVELIGDQGDGELTVTGFVVDEPFMGTDIVRVMQKSPRWLDQKNNGARDVPYLEAGAGEQSSGDGILIEFELPTSALVRLGVYDVRGRLVRTIINEPRVSGKHSFVWNSRDASGQRLASGFYFVTLEAGEVNLIDKVLIVR